MEIWTEQQGKNVEVTVRYFLCTIDKMTGEVWGTSGPINNDGTHGWEFEEEARKAMANANAAFPLQAYTISREETTTAKVSILTEICSICMIPVWDCACN